MPSPRFSVVVPTRERPATLRHALRTCLDQDFDDYEIIVCDNFGGPATRTVAEETGSPRVRYIRSDRPLAMSANWELAVQHAVGEYVLVVGDDDGLLPFALSRADQLLRQTQVSLLRWDWVFYNWPNHMMPNQANGLEIPLGWGFRMVRGAEPVLAVVNDGAWHPALPMLYNSVVRRSLLDELRAKAGRVFASVCPDLYSGISLAIAAGEFGNVHTPLSICGSSGGTYGGNVVVNPDSALAREFWALNAASGFDWHPLVPRVPVLPAFTADAFLHAKDRLFPDDATLMLDRSALAMACLGAARADEDEWGQVIEQIAATLTDVPELRDAFLTRARDVPRNRRLTAEDFAGTKPWIGIRQNRLCLNAADYGVTNVHEAAKLAGQIVSGRPAEAEWLGSRVYSVRR